MGELADRIRALTDDGIDNATLNHARRQLMADELAAIAARAEIVEQENESLASINAELEQWRDAQFDAEQPLSFVDAKPLPLTVDNLLAAQEELKEPRELLKKRLAAAEKRAEQAWATATRFAEHHGRPVAMTTLRSIHDENGHGALSETYVPSFVRGIDAVFSVKSGVHDLVVVAYDASDAPNPDLLERRGTELIEAGERLLAEYQRQRAEAEPLTCSECNQWPCVKTKPATTESMDAIARDFCAQIVENVKP